jgi:hypothetical protein
MFFIIPFPVRAGSTKAEIYAREMARWDAMSPKERAEELALLHGPEILELYREIEKENNGDES